MTKNLDPIPLVFWRSATNREPVREWLNELSREDKRIIGRDIANDGMLVALHAILKKTQKTPTDDLALARQRFKELQSWQRKTPT